MTAPPAVLKEPGASLVQPPRLDLDDPLEPFVAKVPRTQAEEDRLHATALFATARTLERRGEPSAALAKYERAFRYDTQTDAILYEIVSLAFHLGRHDEAVRYALIGAERHPTDPALLLQLAHYLTDRGEWKRSLRLYESLLEAQKNAEDGDTISEVPIKMEMGRLYFLVQNFDRASAAFTIVQSALENEGPEKLDDQLKESLLGDAGLTYRLFAECHLEAGRTDEAKKAFQHAHEAENISPGVLGYNLARIAAKEKKPKLALEKLELYFDEKLSDEGIAPYELLAGLLADLGEQDTAGSRLEQLYAADPDNASLGYFMAGRFLESESLKRAENIYRRIIETSAHADNELDKKRSLILAYRGLIEIHHKKKNVPALYDVLSKTVADTGSIELVEDVAKQVALDTKVLAELDQIGNRRWKNDPEQTTGDESLAMAQLAALAQNFDMAGKYYDRTVEKLPDRAAELTLTWGLELFLADRYDEAIAVFARGIDAKLLPDDNPVFHGFQAEALEMIGKTDGALAVARRAVELQKKSVRMAARVPWIEYHANRYNDAIRDYRQLLEEFGNNHESSDTREALRDVRLMLSNLYVMKEDLTQAEEMLELVLDEFPENTGALNDLGYLWVDQNKRLERSLAMIEKAIAAEPENRAYLDSLGWAFYRLGRFEEAVVELEKAAEGGDEHNGVILDHLGDAYLRLGRLEKARAAWSRAAGAFEKDDETKKAEQIQVKIKKLAEQPEIGN